MADNIDHDQVDVRVALKKKKRKIYKIQTLVIISQHLHYQYITLITN